MNAEEVYALLNKKIKKGGITDDQIRQIVEQYFEKNPVQVITDNTLSVAGIPADALATGTAIDSLKEDIDTFEDYVNPYYTDLKTWGTSFFFKDGVFIVNGGTATIDSQNPLVVTNTTSGVIRTGLIPIDSLKETICIDFEELSKASMSGSLGFFNSNGGYISQIDFNVTNGKAFKIATIPTNAVGVKIFINFYSTTTYTFKNMYMYYGTEQIFIKTFNDVFKVENGLLGMKWGAVGDSITATATLGAGVDNYTNYVSDSLGLTLVNLGVAGTGYMNENRISKAFWQRYTDIPSDTDVLTVFGSLNDLDLAYNNLGELKDNNTTTLYGCMNTFLNGVYSINAGMRVGMILPTPWQWMNRRYPGEITTLKTEQYINALIEFAKFNSIPILNLFDESGVRPWDDSFRTTYYKNSDGTHPNSLGHYRFIYPKVKAFIEQLVAK